jgi:hypothetical protein
LVLPAADERGFTAHSIGKAMTYARRYSWQAITGTVGEDDDDGNSASGVGSREEAQAVGKAKIAALQASSKAAKDAPLKGNEAGLSLFYIWYDESQRAEITGAESLMKLNKDILKRYWDATAKAVLVTGDQLESLKFELEKRKVPFSSLKPPQRQPGED